MSQTTVLTVLQQTLWAAIKIGGPILLAALVIGVIISLFQAVTQVNEMTLSYVPKILVIAAVLIFAGPWMLQTLIDFTARLYSAIPTLVK